MLCIKIFSEDLESISLEYYKEAAELFLQQDYAQPWPFENLARANLLNAKGDGVNVSEADVGLSSRSKMVGIMFVHLLDNTNSDTKHETYYNWLLNEAKLGDTGPI